jgi:predicted DNA-binding antitoxin AbrB/MazE fold protein
MFSSSEVPLQHLQIKQGQRLKIKILLRTKYVQNPLKDIDSRVFTISLRLGFRRNFLSVSSS